MAELCMASGHLATHIAGPAKLGYILGGLIVGSTLAQPVEIIEQRPDNVFIRDGRGQTNDPEAPARLARIIDGLAATDFQVRAQADRALFEDPGISLSMIERELNSRGEALSLDTRVRLTSAAKTRFAETPRAAMGIQFWQNGNLRDRVVIERTFPNFDANTKLEDGDMFIEVDGVPLSGPSARTRFQSVIVARDPGESVPVVIRRGDKKLSLSIRLGGRTDLPNASFVDPGMIERAWAVRSAAYVRVDGEAAIVPPLKASEWNDKPLGGQFKLDRLAARQKGAPGAGPELVGGGMPRGVDREAANNGQQLAGGIVRRNGQLFVNGIMWMPAQFDPLAQEANLAPLSPQDELNELVRARTSAAGSVDRARNNRRAVLPDGQIVAIQDFVAKDIAMIDKQIAAIRAEMTEAGLSISEPPNEPAAHGGAEIKSPPGAP
jgi:hypothetical protein